MSLKIISELSKIQGFLDREKTRFGPSSIQNRSSMTLK
jgi:hypothetical protein